MTQETERQKEARIIHAMYVAHCVCCTLAPGMKICSACPFAVGLAVRTINDNTLSLPVEKREEYWKMLSTSKWEAYVNYLESR